ncbi:MAG TPA: hypothetical protein VK436_04035 [Methanocella sp.]|nr:hypothetical protein [Methanocella sp.]
MYRQRDITDSIAVVSLIFLISATFVAGILSLLGVSMPETTVTMNGTLNTSVLYGLTHTHYGIDFKHMDPVTKILFGAVSGLVMFLLLTMGWVYMYRRNDRSNR